MKKPSLRRVWQGVRTISSSIADLASKRRENAARYSEARDAANSYLTMSKGDRRKIMSNVKRGGLPYVVREMERGILGHEYQRGELKLKKKDGSTVVLKGLDTERARIGKLVQIRRLSNARSQALGACDEIINQTKLQQIVVGRGLIRSSNRVFAETLGKIYVQKKPATGKTTWWDQAGIGRVGKRYRFSSRGTCYVDIFIEKDGQVRLEGTEEFTIKPEDREPFKDYYRATREYVNARWEYRQQEWAEKQ